MIKTKSSIEVYGFREVYDVQNVDIMQSDIIVNGRVYKEVQLLRLVTNWFAKDINGVYFEINSSEVLQ